MTDKQLLNATIKTIQNHINHNVRVNDVEGVKFWSEKLISAMSNK